MRSLPTATAADLWIWHPIGGRRRWGALVDSYEDEPWTALDVLDPRILPRRCVSDDDRLCVALRPELVPESVLREFSYLCDERGMERERKAGLDPDPHGWVATRRQRLSGDWSNSRARAVCAASCAVAVAASVAEAALFCTMIDHAAASPRRRHSAASLAEAALKARAAERGRQVRDLRRLLRAWQVEP